MGESEMQFGQRVLLLGLLHIQLGGARVLTQLPSGPLFRVVGYPLHIPCNVSGFKDADREKEFQFRMQQPGKSMEINIISTHDTAFAYGQFRDRVKNKEITLENVAPNSVFFTMTNLIANDEGEYDCAVVNDEAKFDGVYSTKIMVKVIDNTLSVSSPDTTSVNLDEGDPLTLTCQASSNTVQHTHLSVTWYLRKNGEEHAHPIVSLDQDLTLTPGPRFKERYRAGAVRLDKVGDATYRLSIVRLEQSDQGSVYCQAQEWIQDPDRSWYSITQKDSEATTLNVKATDKVEVDEASLAVRISVQQETLQEGQELVVTCSVDNVPPGQLFSLAWLRGSSELAHFGPTGILQVGDLYESRETGGELMATKVGDRVHRLVLRPVRVQDQGLYLCRAWPQDRGPNGNLVPGVAQDSGSQMVNISATESGLLVEMETESVADVTEGNKLQLTCKVTGFRGQLSITWEHKPEFTAASPFRHVVSLGHDGVMELGPDFAQRSVRVTRTSAHVFTLELSGVIPSDAGTYQYTVSVWTAKPNGDVEKTHSQSRTCHVAVRHLETLLTVGLSSRNTEVTVGDELKLWCQVKGPSAATTLTWTLRRDRFTTTDTILTRSPCGAVTWQLLWQHRCQLRVEEHVGKTFHKLIIPRASPRDAGDYWCEASVFLENRHKKMPLSNQLAVVVKKPESKLSLRSKPSISSNVNTDVTIECNVSATTPRPSCLAVTWRDQGSNRTILSSGCDAVVTSPGAAGDERRISMRRTKGPIFELTIRQARVADSGRYSCVVVEWLQDPDDNWFDLPPVETTTELFITEAASKLSIGGGGATNLTVSPSQSFVLPCNITTQSSESSAFQVTWFWQAEEREERPIFTVFPKGTQQDSSGKPERLRFDHPLPGLFSLTVSGAMPGDSGAYHCRVEEWLLFPAKKKVGAGKRSQKITVVVHADLPGSEKEDSDTGWYSTVLPGVLTGIILFLLLIILVLVLKIRRGQHPGTQKAHSLWTEGHPLESKPALDE